MCVCAFCGVFGVQKGYSWFGGGSRNVWSRLSKIYFGHCSLKCSEMVENALERCFMMWFGLVSCDVACNFGLDASRV